MARLFRIQAGDILLASLNTPTEYLNRDLHVRFKKEVEVPAQGVFHLGSSCALRIKEREARTRNYTWTALSRPSGRHVSPGTEYHVQNIVLSQSDLRAEFADADSGEAKFEMLCSHPSIREWTVTSFEIHNQGILELRSNIQRDPASELHRYRAPGLELGRLNGSEWNGYFGSGLPGTSGVQLLIGSNPQAFADNGNRSLWVGNRCAVIGDESSNNSAQYAKDSKYAFQGKFVDFQKRRVQFQFRNWSYALENLTIECSGAPEEILAMTTSQVEADLNHAVHFYNK